MMNFMDNDKSEKDGMTFDEFISELINGVKQIDRNLDCSGVLKASKKLKEGQIKGESKMSNKDFFTDDMEYIIKDRQTGETLCKGKTASVDNIPKNNDIQQVFCKGDMVEILEEPFVGVQGKIVDEVKLMNKFLVKIGDINSLYIDKDKVKLVKKKVEKREFYRHNLFDIYKVTIRGKRTTVRLGNGTQASVYCHENDEYNEELAIKLAYNKARRKDLDKEYEKLLDRVESKNKETKDKEGVEEDNIIGKKANVYFNGKLIAEGIIEEGTYFKYSVEYTKNFEDNIMLRCDFDELNKPFVGLVVKLAE